MHWRYAETKSALAVAVDAVWAWWSGALVRVGGWHMPARLRFGTENVAAVQMRPLPLWRDWWYRENRQFGVLIRLCWRCWSQAFHFVLYVGRVNNVAWRNEVGSIVPRGKKYQHYAHPSHTMRKSGQECAETRGNGVLRTQSPGTWTDESPLRTVPTPAFAQPVPKLAISPSLSSSDESGSGFESDLPSWDAASFSRRQPWRKLLWVQQPYPDNYVDDSFLSQMKQNSHVQQYTFWALSSDSAGILAHLCTVAVFVISFLGIYSRGWNPIWFAVGSSALTVVSYVFWRLVLVDVNAAAKEEGKSIMTTLKSSLLILFTLLALSPVLKSLTQSTSSDSIWALTVWLCLANICFNNYSSLSSPSSSSTMELKSILSTNFALSAAIMLASRLSTTMSVFSFVLFSIQIFGVFPTFLRVVRNPHPKHSTTASWQLGSSSLTYWVLLIAMVIVSSIGLFAMGGVWVLVLWLAILFSVVIVLPALLLALQKYKKYVLPILPAFFLFSNFLVKFKGHGILPSPFSRTGCSHVAVFNHLLSSLSCLSYFTVYTSLY